MVVRKEQTHLLGQLERDAVFAVCQGPSEQHVWQLPNDMACAELILTKPLGCVKK